MTATEIIFGLNSVKNALLADRRKIFQLFAYHNPSQAKRIEAVDEVIALCTAKSIPIQYATRNEIDRLCFDRPHQNVALKTSTLKVPVISSIHDLEAPQADTSLPLFIALSGILDPQNLGSIIRTAHFYNCTGVILPSKESCSLTPIVSKASAGSLEVYNRILHANSLLKVVKSFKSEGYRILGTACHSEKKDDKPQTGLSQPTLLLIGSEGSGLSASLLKECDENVFIEPTLPLPTGFDSLNAAVAAAVLVDRLHRR